MTVFVWLVLGVLHWKRIFLEEEEKSEDREKLTGSKCKFKFRHAAWIGRLGATPGLQG